MNALLVSGRFNDFELSGGQISTFMSFTIDGALHRDFYSEDTMPEEIEDGKGPEEKKNGGLTPWSLAAPAIFSLIKGKNPPLSMKLILKLEDARAHKLAAGAALTYPLSDLKGLFLNISYDQGKVTCTTGTSLSIFTTDRTMDQVWDEAAGRFLASVQG